MIITNLPDEYKSISHRSISNEVISSSDGRTLEIQKPKIMHMKNDTVNIPFRIDRIEAIKHLGCIVVS